MEDNSEKMSFLGHFNELRKRLLVCVVALVLTVVISFTFCQKLAEYLAVPIGGLSEMAAIDVTENVSAYMKISLLSGVVLALPVLLYEILAFILPGLTPKERSWIWLIIPSATILFIAGVAFCYYYMLPAALPFLLDFMGIETSPRPSTYFNFVLNLMFWVGVCFEMPLLFYVLARLGIIKAKMLLKQWRIAIVASAVLAAVITPTPDPVNMGLMMVPLMILYAISIGFAYFGSKSHEEKNQNEEIETDDSEEE